MEPDVTTLEDLLPLLADVKTCKEFGAVMIANVPQKLKRRLALEARDALGFKWADKSIIDWLSPSRHMDARAKANRENTQKWLIKNPEASRDYQGRYKTQRYANDPVFAIRRAASSRINQALNTALTGKSASTIQLLGCSADEYRQYLEGLFQPGMSWDNWSPDSWHVDHIRPIASFDLSDPDQQRQAFHYTNTQPLWSKDNLAKGSLYEGLRHQHG